jgi:two-component system capsular synthesis sensor histidine kinase RcsC
MHEETPASRPGNQLESHLTDRMVLFSACLGMLLLFALVAVYVGSVFVHAIEERATWGRILFGEVLIRKIGIEDYVRGVSTILTLKRREPDTADEVDALLKDRLPGTPPGEWQRLAATPLRVSVGVMHWLPDTAVLPFLLDQGERLAQIDAMVLRAANAQPELRSILLDVEGRFLLTAPAPGRSYEGHAVAVTAAKPAFSFLGIPPHVSALDPGDHGCDWRQTSAAFGAVVCLRMLSDAEGKPAFIVGVGTTAESLFSSTAPREHLPDRLAFFAGDGTLLTDRLLPGTSASGEKPAVPSFVGWRLGSGGLHATYIEPGNPQGWRLLAVYPIAGILSEQAVPLVFALLVFMGGAVLVLGSAWRIHSRVVLPARRQAIEIQESEAFHRTAMRTAPVGLVVLRRSDGELLDANAIGHELLSDRQVRRDILLREAELAAEGADTIAGIEVAWRTLDNQVRALSVAAADFRFRGQSALFCAVTDVSLYKALVLDLAQAKRDADTANAAKSAFLATMSHEIRTPLYGMLGSLELMAGTGLDARQRERLGAIQHSSSALLQIVNDLLDFSKIEAGELSLREETFDPVELIEEVVRSLAPLAAAKNLALVCCIEPGLPKLRGDPLRLRQILSNLLSNAIKYTERGRVLVSLTSTVEGARRALSLRVVDTGPGMSQEEQARLFTPFVQGEGGNAKGGTGLGLSICRQLAELMHGRIDVASERFLGSSFTLRVSLPQEGVASRPSLVGVPPVRIHVADPDNAENLAALVRHCGGRVLGAEEADVEPRILLLDSLPGALGGACVSLLPDAPQKPAPRGQGWIVSPYSQLGIVEALAAAGGADIPGGAAKPANRLAPQLGLSVLVAEDHPINRMLLRDQLEALGCSVVLAGDGQEALAHWHASQFDLVLTDVNMPVCDGFALTRNLRAQGVTKPIVGVTARLGDEVRCIGAGMDACIIKPVTMAALGEALRPFAHAMSVIAADPDRPEPLPPDLRRTIVTVLREDIDKLASLVRSGEHAKAGGEAHRLKGALASLDAPEAAAACADLERALRAGNAASITAHFDVLEREVVHFMEVSG